jgi:opacity protein-like surface antigen
MDEIRMQVRHFGRTFLTMTGIVVAMLAAAGGTPTAAQDAHAFRGGVQFGLASERSRYSWPSGDGGTSGFAVDANYNGFIGLILDFPLRSGLLLEFAPHYGQRNVPIATMQRRGGVKFTIQQGPVDYIGIPMLAKYLPFGRGLIQPYIGAGVEFGLNLTSLFVSIEEYRYSGEGLTNSTMAFRRNLNQLYGAGLLEGGFDIRAAEDWSVLLGVRYTRELTPLLEDPMLTWETPRNWRIRLSVLYTFGEGIE